MPAVVPRNWADVMDEEECRASPEPEGDDDVDEECMPANTWDELMSRFPVPGELYVHLVGYANFYSALLHTNPPPAAGDMPFLVRVRCERQRVRSSVNCWQQVSRSAHSPFRIQYGTANPALRGLIITSSMIIPNFGWTPRLAVETDYLTHIASMGGGQVFATQPHIIVVPAIHGCVLRVFHDHECMPVAFPPSDGHGGESGLVHRQQRSSGTSADG